MITRFEELQAWQMARELTKRVYGATQNHAFAKDFKFCGQIQSAALSVGSNIAEGFERGGDKEFIQFLSNSKGSCGEVKSHLYVALDQRYVPAKTFDQLYAKADEVSRGDFEAGIERVGGGVALRAIQADEVGARSKGEVVAQLVAVAVDLRPVAWIRSRRTGRRRRATPGGRGGHG